MPMLRQLTAAILALSLFAPALAQAQAAPDDQRLLTCRDIRESEERLECYDEAMNAIYGVDEVAEAERAKLQRDNFGDPTADEDDVADEIVAVMTHVDYDPRYDILRFQLDNGSVWEATSQGRLRNGFKPGAQATITKGILGGYRVRIEGKRNWRGVKRLR